MGCVKRGKCRLYTNQYKKKKKAETLKLFAIDSHLQF